MSLTESRRGEPGSRTRLTRYAWVVAGCVVFLLTAGAMVTSTGSGLSVPDWPLSFGQVMPPMQGGVFYEHGHRMVATGVGLLTIILAVWLWMREPRAWMRRLGWTALALVIVQGLFGGLTVLLKLPVWTSALHACLAQAFFMLIILLALALTRRWNETARGESLDGRLTGWAVGTTGAIYIQLILGAVMRHMYAGLAVPDFPLVFGGVWPPHWTPQIAIHLAHRLWGTVVVAVVITAFLLARRSRRPDVARLATLLLGLTVLQFLLGASVIWSGRQVHVTSTHVVTGALVLGTSTVLTARILRLRFLRAAGMVLPSPHSSQRSGIGEVPA